ncbi:hypothetical protein ACHAXT_007054 [Thalassiosira profunda]
MDHQTSDIEAWRRVHRQLTLALLQSRDNVAAARAQRRYLLEETNRCRVQNALKIAPGGGGGGGSKVKKKAAPKKAAVSVTKAQVGKASKKTPAAAPAAAAKRAPATAKEAANISKATPPPATVGEASSDNKESSTHTDAGVDALLQLAAGKPAVSSQPPSSLGAAGSNVGVATAQQMDLAFQLMQQMNQSAATPVDGKDDGDADASEM